MKCYVYALCDPVVHLLHLCMSVCMCARDCIYVCMCIYACVCVCVHACACVWYVCASVHAALVHEPLRWVGRVPMGQKIFLTYHP